jgi:hypothetical protein
MAKHILLVGHSFLPRLLQTTDLNSQGLTITTLEKRGAYIRGHSFLDVVERHLQNARGQYGVIIFHLGSNDLDKAQTEVEIDALVDYYVSRVAAMCSRHQLHVVICTEIPRGNDRFPGSFEKTDHFNKRLLEAGVGWPHLLVFRHMGMHKREGYLLLGDQIHFNWENGTNKFYHSIMRAVRHAARFAWGTNYRLE